MASICGHVMGVRARNEAAFVILRRLTEKLALFGFAGRWCGLGLTAHCGKCAHEGVMYFQRYLRK